MHPASLQTQSKILHVHQGGSRGIRVRETQMHACMLGHFSRVRLFATLWTIARQAPLSLGSSRQGHWTGLPRPPQGIFQTPGLNLCLLRPLPWQAGSLTLVPPRKPTLMYQTDKGEFIWLKSGFETHTPFMRCPQVCSCRLPAR